MYVYHFHLNILVFNVFASQINSAFQKMAITQFNLIFRLILQTCNGVKKSTSNCPVSKRKSKLKLTLSLNLYFVTGRKKVIMAFLLNNEKYVYLPRTHWKVRTVRTWNDRAMFKIPLRGDFRIYRCVFHPFLSFKRCGIVCIS